MKQDNLKIDPKIEIETVKERSLTPEEVTEKDTKEVSKNE